jgi:hypothetical protein
VGQRLAGPIEQESGDVYAYLTRRGAAAWPRPIAFGAMTGILPATPAVEAS